MGQVILHRQKRESPRSRCILPTDTCHKQHTAGQCSGTLLFSTFIIDMPEVVNNLITMFADNTKLFRTVNREADSTVFQKDLIAMEEWSDK